MDFVSIKNKKIASILKGNDRGNKYVITEPEVREVVFLMHRLPKKRCNVLLFARAPRQLPDQNPETFWPTICSTEPDIR
jgi:hypothetical protein